MFKKESLQIGLVVRFGKSTFLFLNINKRHHFV